MMPAVFMGSANSPAIRVTKRPCKARTYQQSGFSATMPLGKGAWVVRALMHLCLCSSIMGLYAAFQCSKYSESVLRTV